MFVQLKNGILKRLGVVVIILFLFSFLSCRKGEEDPFISLRSRDKRIVGEWHLRYVSGHIITIYDGLYMDYQYFMDGSVNESFRYKKVREASGFYVNAENYYMLLTIREDKTYTYRVQIRGDFVNRFYEYEGTWDWRENKESIWVSTPIVYYDQYIEEFAGNYSDYIGFAVSESEISNMSQYELLGLSNDEMQLVLKYKSMSSGYLNADIRYRFIKEE